jgi:hypothetical protein
LERNWNFVYPIGRQLSPAAKAFIDYVRARVRSLPENDAGDAAL